MVRFGVVALAALAILLVAAPAEAKFKIKLKSTPKARSAPSVSKPHVPDAPNMQPSVETGPRLPRVNVALTSQSRGYFQRIWDWLFGRKPAPAAAPAGPMPAPAPVPPSAVAAPATPPVILPVALPAAAPASPASSATAQSPGKELENLPDLTPPPPRPEPIVKGYIIHLKNGRRISTSYYQDKGNEVVIPQHGGTYGLSKSLVARIEVVKEYP
ncbi:MAG TPA: hypothetical protein VLG48_06840 [Candidatus Methylomirabilis sp.]|nr:hypothetical protein [Candidatus Methylomirabilis sp.]